MSYIRKEYYDRYIKKTWRASLFAEMVIEDILSFEMANGKKPTVLDIGCGHGLDSCRTLQHKIAGVSGRYIGVEPDTSIQPAPCFSEVYHSLFEDAPIPPGSVDIAFSAFVLEHIADPTKFFAKLEEVFSNHGVFWGFTIDARHPFAFCSTFLEKIKMKDFYLDCLQGKRGEERYENYPTFYRINSPHRLKKYCHGAHICETASWNRVGQLDAYVPKALRPFSHLFDRIWMGMNLPGYLFFFRIQKKRETA